jgi:hypothetical protein
VTAQPGTTGPNLALRICCDDLDADQPGPVGVRCLFAQVSSCAALDHFDHPSRFEVDEAGRVDRVMVPVRAQERRLVHPEVAHGSDSVQVVDERGAVLDNCAHDRLPTHPQLAGDLRNRTGKFAYPAPRLGTSPPRQHDLRVQELERFGPRPRCTQHLAVTPPALPNSESGSPAEALQIADIGPHPILAFGASPAPLAPRSGLGRFDLDRHLTIGLAHASDAYAIDSKHGLSQPTTVSHRRDLLIVAVVEQPQPWRDPCTQRGTLRSARSPLQREELVSVPLVGLGIELT